MVHLTPILKDGKYVGSQVSEEWVQGSSTFTHPQVSPIWITFETWKASYFEAGPFGLYLPKGTPKSFTVVKELNLPYPNVSVEILLRRMRGEDQSEQMMYFDFQNVFLIEKCSKYSLEMWKSLKSVQNTVVQFPFKPYTVLEWIPKSHKVRLWENRATWSDRVYHGNPPFTGKRVFVLKCGNSCSQRLEMLADHVREASYGISSKKYEQIQDKVVREEMVEGGKDLLTLDGEIFYLSDHPAPEPYPTSRSTYSGISTYNSYPSMNIIPMVSNVPFSSFGSLW
jgi:hypothetical protein